MSTDTVEGLTENDLARVREPSAAIKHALIAVTIVGLGLGPGAMHPTTADAAPLVRNYDWGNLTTGGALTPVSSSRVQDSSRTTTAAAAASAAERIECLKAETDLTWDQIARLFGVSRRAVHQWAAGGRMNASNTELLAQLERALVTEIPETDSGRRRAAIFASDLRGSTPFERALMLRATPEVWVSGNALSAVAQVSAEQ